MVDLNSRLGTVGRMNGDCVALATPTDLRRRDGLKAQGSRCGQLKKITVKCGKKVNNI